MLYKIDTRRGGVFAHDVGVAGSFRLFLVVSNEACGAIGDGGMGIELVGAVPRHKIIDYRDRGSESKS